MRKNIFFEKLGNIEIKIKVVRYKSMRCTNKNIRASLHKCELRNNKKLCNLDAQLKIAISVGGYNLSFFYYPNLVHLPTLTTLYQVSKVHF